MINNVKFSDVKAGDKLITTQGFECIRSDRTVTIQADKAGELFFKCARGAHYLRPQACRWTGVLLGLTKVNDTTSEGKGK
jgi:hypothetical protein